MEAVLTPVGLVPAYRLPQQQKFSSEDPDGETFEDWIEQFVMIAKLYKWSEAAKLVKWITRLRGPAYSFFRAWAKRELYSTKEADKDTTPGYSEWAVSRQKAKKSVDEYPQDLRRLFRKVYGKAQQGSQEAKRMGHPVLTYQFVAGLWQKLKTKVAGWRT